MVSTGEMETPAEVKSSTGRAGAVARRWLARAWRGRGLPGGLLAIWLGWQGQQALLASLDFTVAFRYYSIATVVLILSLLHPEMPSWLARRLKPTPQNTSTSDQEISTSEEAVTQEVPPRHPVENGHTPIPTEVASDSLPEVSEADRNGGNGSNGGSEVPASLLVITTLPIRRPSQRASTQSLVLHNIETEVAQAEHPLQITTLPPGEKSNGSNGANNSVALTTHDFPEVLDSKQADADSTEPASPATLPQAEVAPASKQRLWARWKEVRARLGWKITLPGLVLTVGLATGAALVLWQDYRLPLGGWLWAASLGALFLTLLGAPGWPRGGGLLPDARSDFFGRGVPSIPARWEALLVGAVLLGAIILRTIDLENFPGVEQDEAFHGLDARAIVNGNPAPLFGSGWYWIPNVPFYLVSFMLRIFGDNMVGTRMLSVVAGVLTVWFVYRIGRLLWGPRVGLIAGAMLAVSPLALQYGRVLSTNTETGMLWAAGFFYFFMALRYHKWSDWALAGACWAFNLYFYPAGKLIIPLVGLVGLYCLVRWRLQFFKQHLLGFVLLGFAFALTFMPYGIFSWKFDNWEGFAGRAREASIFSPRHQQEIFARYNLPFEPAWVNETTQETLLKRPWAWTQVIYQQARISSEVLYTRQDGWGFYKPSEHNGSMFSPFWAVLAVLGLTYATWKIWDPRYGIVSLWFWMGIMGMALMADIPSVLRASGAWSAVMLFPASLVDRIFSASWPLSRGLARKWATVPLIALVIYLAVDAYREYFGHYATLCYQCRVTTQARYIQALGKDYKGYEGAVNSDISFGQVTTAFIAKGVEGVDLLTPTDYSPIIDNSGKGAAFIMYPHMYQYVPMLRTFYPDGKEEPVNSPDGFQQFVSYKVAREQLAASQTLHATYTTRSAGNALTITRDEPTLGMSGLGLVGSLQWSPPPDLTYPSTAQWQGGLVAPSYGSYTFAVDGNGDTKLEIDGQTFLDVVAQGTGSSADPAARKVEVALAKGIHDVRLTATLRDVTTYVNVTWAGGSSAPIPIESRYLYNGLTGGLSGEIAPMTDITTLASDNPLNGMSPTMRRSDPYLGFRLSSYTFGNNPFVARWQGSLNVPVEGDYGFRVEPPTRGLLLIDGQIVAGQAPGVAHLTAGTHQIDVRSAWQYGSPEHFELFWSIPGSGQDTLVPPSVLRPLARSWRRSVLPDAPTAQIPPPVVAPKKLQPIAVIGAGSGLSDAHGVGVDKDGNIYVGDNGNKRIVVYAPDGKIVRTFGKAATPDSTTPVPGEFRDIRDIAVAPDGTVHVLDAIAGTVQTLDSSGKVLRVVDPGSLWLYGPNGIALGADGSVYIADTGHNRIVKLSPSPDAQPMSQFMIPNPTNSTPPPDWLEQTVDALIGYLPGDTVERIFAVDLKNRIIAMPVGPARSEEEGRVRQWAVPVGGASGGSKLAASPDNSRIFMTDPDRQRVAVLDTGTGRVTYFGESGSESGQFAGPSGIAVGPDDKVYVLDRINGNVQVFVVPK
ncbi:MAG TPA: glycosyltransferase family 39 protein [Chloroflexia bacterium]|nr:glycosyltransferase family 39 protein [Chloroflexia bacterium]